MEQTVLKKVGYNEYVVLSPGAINGDLMAAVLADGSRIMLATLPDGSRALVRLTVRLAPPPPFRAPGIPGSPPECLGDPYLRRTVRPETRAAVKERDGHQCLRCGWKPDNSVFSTGRLELDHIVPVASGGCSHEHNLQTLCRTCNRRKQSKHPDGPQPGTADGAIGLGPCPCCGKVGAACVNQQRGECTWCEESWSADHRLCCLVRWAWKRGHQVGWHDSVRENRVQRTISYDAPVKRFEAGPRNARLSV